MLTKALLSGCQSSAVLDLLQNVVGGESAAIIKPVNRFVKFDGSSLNSMCEDDILGDAFIRGQEIPTYLRF